MRLDVCIFALDGHTAAVIVAKIATVMWRPSFASAKKPPTNSRRFKCAHKICDNVS